MISKERIEEAYSKLVSTTHQDTFTAGVRFAEAEMKQTSMEFVTYIEKDCREISVGVFECITDCIPKRYTTAELFVKFEAERGDK